MTDKKMQPHVKSAEFKLHLEVQFSEGGSVWPRSRRGSGAEEDLSLRQVGQILNCDQLSDKTHRLIGRQHILNSGDEA